MATKENCRKYYQKNKERIKAAQRARHAQQREQNIERMKQYYSKHADTCKLRVSEYRKKNLAAIKAKKAQHYQKNKDAINARYYAALKNDPIKRIKHNMRTRLNKILKHKNSFTCSLGCSTAELKAYLESKFQPGMTWENHGPMKPGFWQVDHIKPLSKFDLRDPEQFKQACHYMNLQPLWTEAHFKKGLTDAYK